MLSPQIMPRALVSFWKRVAVSGPTADNREITPQELREVAETYDPRFYTAVIWCEHEREKGAHGTVYSVRLVEDDPELEPGQVSLEAQLKPNDKLLWLNDQGEKLFSSIEIHPNFRGSGKAYLTGFAVTDEPASTRTQELYFSRRSSNAAYYAASVELGSLRKDALPVQGLIQALTGLFSRLGFGAPDASRHSVSSTSATESQPPMELDEATQKALRALLEQQVIVTAGLQAIIEPLTTEVTEEEVAEQVDAVLEAVTDVVDEADGKFSRRRKFSRRKKPETAPKTRERSHAEDDDQEEARFQKLTDSIETLTEKFSQVLDKPLGERAPRVRGAAEPKKRVV